MNSKKILFVLVSLWLCLTAQAQTQKEDTLSMLTHTVWKCSEPQYSDYQHIVFTDTTTTRYNYYNKEETFTAGDTNLFYLTDRVETFFDKSKIGKVRNGNHCMYINRYGTFVCYRIYELTNDKLVMAIVQIQGRGKSPNIPGHYTPVDDKDHNAFIGMKLKRRYGSENP